MRIIFDSCLLLALLHKEKNWQAVKKYLFEARSKKHKIFFCWVNLLEVYYKVYRKKGLFASDKALSVIKNLPLTIVLPDEELFVETARIKGKYPIALADCFVLAMAKKFKANVLTGDPEFKKAGKSFKIVWLGN